MALDPNKVGDYFIYFAVQKVAMFQVSEVFGEDFEDVLLSQGIRGQAIVRRMTTVFRAPQNLVTKQVISQDFLQGIATSVGIGANLSTIVDRWNKYYRTGSLFRDVRSSMYIK